MNTHLKNVGKVITGKETDKILPRNTEKGLLAKVQNILFVSMSTLSTMEIKTDNTIRSLNEFERIYESKKSVKAELKDI